MTYQRPVLSTGLQALQSILGTQDKAQPPGDGQGSCTQFCGGQELDD